MDELSWTRSALHGARRHVVGLGVLLLTVVPAYVTFRVPMPETIVVSPAAAVMDADEPDEPETKEITLADIKAHIRDVAARYAVSPRLVAAIVEAESEFNPRAVSRRGAQGLMQLMPATASSLQVEDAFDPRANIDGGVRHLRRLMDRFDGDLPVVLAAYNAGEQTVMEHGGVPPYPETRRYVRRILRRIGHPRPAELARRPAAPRVVLVGTRPEVVARPELVMRPDLLVRPEREVRPEPVVRAVVVETHVHSYSRTSEREAP